MRKNNRLFATLAIVAGFGFFIPKNLDIPATATASRDSRNLYSFDMRPTSRAPGARGRGNIDLAWSPFGLSVTADGYLVYDMVLQFEGLLPANRFGPDIGYVAWIASPRLDRIEKLGVIDQSNELSARLNSWNKFMILVTAERNPLEAATRGGPVLLRGMSPSGLVESFQSHELFTDVPD